MAEQDLHGVVLVAEKSFPDHPEDMACFANRLALNPEGCFTLVEDDGTVRGYLVSYPWHRFKAPALNVLIDAIPHDADSYYLHDLAIDPAVRGGGHTRAVVEVLAERAKAKGWPQVSLVAVNNATGFWQRNGFEVQMPDGMAQKLASYGEDARYMERTL